MLNTSVHGLRSELAKAIYKTDKILQLPVGEGVRFKIPKTDHFYMTIRNGSNREYVKVVDVKGDVLSVERGEDGTTPGNFPKGSCLEVDWNPSQLCEFVRTCLNGGNQAKITPQTICFTCDTCVEVDEGGHIINVNGSEKC